MRQDQKAELIQINGLYVGQLNSEETELFELAAQKGWARRVYEGATGDLGLAKVRLTAAL